MVVYNPRHARALGALVLLALLAFGVEVLSGPTALGRESLAALLGHADPFTEAIVRTIRLPRAAAAFSVGALLAVAGTLLQALFRNPLADPLVVGVAGGAGVGAVAAMLAGLGLGTMHALGAGGGFLAGIGTLWLGRGGGATRLLLTGVLFANVCGALVTLLLALATNGQLRGMVSWLAGDLSWSPAPLTEAVIAVLATIAAASTGRYLNVLAAGEVRSATLGLPGTGARLVVFALSATLTAVAVIAGGMIGFVGLIAPHAARLGLGTSDHRVVAPAAALAGGTLVSLADAVSRLVAAPRELPVGAVMALVGAPFFLVLLRRQLR